MRFLLDMPIPLRVARFLGERGHDALHAFAIGLARAPDREVLERARNDGRVVITADTDFPQLLALSQAAAPGVILFRGGNYRAEEVEDLLARVLAQVPELTLARSVCVVERGRVRCRPLPLR